VHETVSVMALLGPGPNEGSEATSPEVGLRETRGSRCSGSGGVVARHQAARRLIRAIKRMHKTRNRLRERETSRLRVKLKLGYELPAEAYL
jgi:hypothetical protein